MHQAPATPTSAVFIGTEAAAAATTTACTFGRVRNIRINRTVAVAAVDGCIKHDLRVAAFRFLLLLLPLFSLLFFLCRSESLSLSFSHYNFFIFFLTFKFINRFSLFSRC